MPIAPAPTGGATTSISGAGRPYDAPVLLEREHELDVLRHGLRQVGRGSGTGVAVAGDSGTGKSSLLAAAVAEAGGLRVLRAQCDPFGTPRPLGPVRDLRLPGLVEVLGEETHPGEVAAAFLGALGTESTVLVVEDLHWVDAASADVLRHVLRRVETVPVLVLLSYRDAEIGARHPARRLLGDVAALEPLRTLALRPLSVAGVGAVVAGTDLDPVRVHALTGGNPFYVAQVALEPDRPLPDSVRDTVLARVSDLEPDDLETLQLVSCSPDGLDEGLLPLLEVGLDTLRRLDATTLLARTDRGLGFRHELARQAVETTIPPGGAPRLHHRLLGALERSGTRDTATLTHHAAAARDTARTHAYALAAAVDAVAAASNAEAAAFLELALAHQPTDAPAAERAGLLVQLALQLYVTARLPEAGSAARASIPLFREAGHTEGVAEVQALLCVLEYQAGRRAPSERHGAQATQLAATLPAGATVGRVHADCGMVALVGSDLDLAVDHGRRAEAAGLEAGLEEHVLGGRLLVEGVACVSGEPGARERVLALVDTARLHGWDELAWRGYIMATIHDMERGLLRDFQQMADLALAHTTARDLRNATLWHLGLRAHLHATAGRWSAAREDAEEILASGASEGSIWPHVALATVAQRVGDRDAAAHLDQAWRLALTLDEPGRVLPVLHALAEQMWLTGVVDRRVTEQAHAHLERAWRTRDQRSWAAELAVRLRRVHVRVELPTDLPAPYDAHLAGRTASVAAWWCEAGNPFAEAMAYADAPDPDDRVHAVGLLDRLGALATADRLRRQLRSEGLAHVPSRPSGATRANPGGLTNRQLEVARLVARGYTNVEIAEQAFISPKTAEHHVSAVLAKLGVANRRDLVVRAAELGLD